MHFSAYTHCGAFTNLPVTEVRVRAFVTSQLANFTVSQRAILIYLVCVYNTIKIYKALGCISTL